MSGSCATCNKDNCTLRCSACKCVYYCSANCQKSDWSKHKPECQKQQKDLKPEKVQTKVVVDEGKSDEPKEIRQVTVVVAEGTTANEVKMPETELGLDKGWKLCKFPTMFGVSLMYKRLSYLKQKPSHEMSIFLLVEPKSGLADYEFQMQVGRMAFAKTDLSDFTTSLYWDVYSYAYHLMDFYGDEDFNYEQFKKRKLIPESFRRYQAQEHGIQEQYQQSLRAHNFVE